MHHFILSVTTDYKITPTLLMIYSKTGKLSGADISMFVSINESE